MLKSWEVDYSIYLTSTLNRGWSLGEGPLRSFSFLRQNVPRAISVSSILNFGICVCCSVVTVFIASVTPGLSTWGPRPSSWTATVCRRSCWRGQRWETWDEFRKPSFISERPCVWHPAALTATKAGLCFNFLFQSLCFFRSFMFCSH